MFAAVANIAQPDFPAIAPELPLSRAFHCYCDLLDIHERPFFLGKMALRPAAS
jgi:hypothetical protein